MSDKDVLKIFNDTNALLTGHFKLSSGLHSEKYLQCALVLQYPEHAKKLCAALAQKFSAVGGKEKPTAVVAPALGGVIVSYEVANALGCRSLFTEREEGKMVLRRGFMLSAADRVVVVEDVVTTGGSTKEVIEAVRQYGAKIVGVGAIINRSSEPPEFNVNFEYLLKVDVKTFQPQGCPLCKNGVPLVKPGSRKA
ncbi:MAG: orotate phosphoribosyltransferase [Candidatus Omnitrophica bacterium]|nr:orotate phosphoribosyltransferase [Candidatus Omnitrophota bacterium]